jgi:hypothetical protein
MVSLNVDIDTTQVARSFNDLTNNLDDTITAALNVTQVKILSDARTYHRFANRTGYLENSLTSSVQKDLAEYRIGADYGTYIHNGFKSWAPDPFLESSVTRNQQYITDTISKSIDGLIIKEGLK